MIEVKNLFYKYSHSKTYALKDINFKIKHGEYIAIVGHNGSGKSTLSKLLVGLFKATKGWIKIDGDQISHKNLRKIRVKIGIVFQNPDNQFIGATVEDDIAFGLENKQYSTAKMQKIVATVVKRVGMEKYLDREPQNLSGGQKQKVAVASVLALDPKIIIFDESTSMLDPIGKREMIEIIESFQTQKNKTIIAITHDMEVAKFADQILVLANGKLVANGAPKEIFSNPEIIKVAKIDVPFIYKLSQNLARIGIKLTFNEKELIEEICK